MLLHRLSISVAKTDGKAGKCSANTNTSTNTTPPVTPTTKTPPPTKGPPIQHHQKTPRTRSCFWWRQDVVAPTSNTPLSPRTPPSRLSQSVVTKQNATGPQSARAHPNKHPKERKTQQLPRAARRQISGVRSAGAGGDGKAEHGALKPSTRITLAAHCSHPECWQCFMAN